MRWQCLSVIAGLLAAWVGWAAWQRHEYENEAQLARQTLERQAESLEHAVVGGIRSHRRLGRYFEAQLQGALDELVESQDVLAAAIGTAGGQPVLAVGPPALVQPLRTAVGAEWLPEALVYVSRFQLSPDSGGGPPGGGRGPGGTGGGRGWGRGTWRDADNGADSRLSAGGEFVAVLVLDRSATDGHLRRAALLRTIVAGAGGVVLVCLGLAGYAVLRLLDARGRAQLLEAEARHLRDLGQAAAGLAHETRNPLGTLRGWTQRLAQSDLQTDEARQRARAVVEECDRLTARINQFLAFARPQDPNRQPVEIAPLVAELAALLGPDLEAKGLQLQFQCPAGAARPVQADREMLRQALFNLAQNAIQSSPPGGTVEVWLQIGREGRARLEVADRGPGVPPEAVDSLFSPYFTTRSNGTGLGLAIVRRIATAHGWHVGYTRRPGGGAVFWIDGMN